MRAKENYSFQYLLKPFVQEIKISARYSFASKELTCFIWNCCPYIHKSILKKKKEGKKKKKKNDQQKYYNLKGNVIIHQTIQDSKQLQWGSSLTWKHESHNIQRMHLWNFFSTAALWNMYSATRQPSSNILCFVKSSYQKYPLL